MLADHMAREFSGYFQGNKCDAVLSLVWLTYPYWMQFSMALTLNIKMTVYGTLHI